MVQAIPPQIFAAIKAGVGGLLVKVSITATRDVALTPVAGTTGTIGYHVTIFALGAGLATILIVKAICALYVKKNPNDAANVESWIPRFSSVGFGNDPGLPVAAPSQANEPRSRFVLDLVRAERAIG